MILRKGNMWDRFGHVDWFLITTNYVVNKVGLAVMGRGIAKEAADRIPSLRKDFGTKLKRWLDDYQFVDPLAFPYVCTIGKYDGQKVGCFMVKYSWDEPARLELIEQSTQRLIEILDSLEIIPLVALNFPGIGNGKLKREDVLPIIERLPDNVEVWEYDE